MTNPTGDALKASAAQVRVKPLEWKDEVDGCIESDFGYRLESRVGSWMLFSPFVDTAIDTSRWPGPLFSSAQADYKSRILAALSVEPAPQPVAWQPAYKPEFIEYLRRTRGDMNEPKVFFPTKKEAEDYGSGGHGARPLFANLSSVSGHPDDVAVDRFASAMKVKLAKKRAEGRGGWDNPDECSIAFLSELLRSHIDKGDPVDVGNLAMMIHQRGGAIE